MIKTKNLTLKSDKLYINEVERFVENICDEHNIYNNYYANILMSVIEAYTNAVTHGNSFDEHKKVTIQFQLESNGLVFRIQDEGSGFDINSIADPTDLKTDGVEGRGLFTIKSLSDNIKFENNGSTVVLEFHVTSINREVANKRAELLHQYINQGVKKEQNN